MKTLFYKVVNLLVVTFFMVSCFDEAEEKVTKKRRTQYEGPALESHDLKVVQTDSAKLVMTMDATQQIIMQNDNQEYPQGIFVTFYDDQEKIESTIKSNYAFYIEKDDKWKLSGDVKVINVEKGQKMDTQLMFWSPSVKDSTNILVPDTVPVIIVEPEQELKGLGLRATDDFSYYKMKNVVATKWLEEE